MREKLIAAGLWAASDTRDPGTSLEAAWLLVDALILQGRVVDLHCNRREVLVTVQAGRGEYWQAIAAEVEDTAPLAICAAALRAASG